jgi:hypothetical protein
MPRKFSPKDLRKLRTEVHERRQFARRSWKNLHDKLAQLEKDKANFSPQYFAQQHREYRETIRHNLSLDLAALRLIIDEPLAERSLHSLESYLIDHRIDPGNVDKNGQILHELHHSIRELCLLQRIARLDDTALADRADYALRAKDVQLGTLLLEESHTRKDELVKLKVRQAVESLISEVPELHESEAFFDEAVDVQREIEDYLLLIEDPKSDMPAARIRARQIREDRAEREATVRAEAEAKHVEQRKAEKEHREQVLKAVHENFQKDLSHVDEPKPAA